MKMNGKSQNTGGRYLSSAKELCYIALSSALLAVCSWIAVPIGSVPVTLQTLALFTLSGLLGAKRASLALLAWLALGLCGVPVFAGFTGGVTVLFSPTGGFLIGFVLATPFMGFFAKRGGVRQKAVAFVLATLAFHLCGLLWFCILYTGFTGVGLLTSLLTCSLPYLPFDFIKIALALFLVGQLKKALSHHLVDF